MSNAPQHRASIVGTHITYRNLSVTFVAEMPGGKVLRHASEPQHLVFISKSDLGLALIEGTPSTHPRRAL